MVYLLMLCTTETGHEIGDLLLPAMFADHKIHKHLPKTTSTRAPNAHQKALLDFAMLVRDFDSCQMARLSPRGELTGI